MVSRLLSCASFELPVLDMLQLASLHTLGSGHPSDLVYCSIFNRIYFIKIEYVIDSLHG